jgi:hypothetical protein
MTNLNVQVTNKKSSNVVYFEATVGVDGLRPTKLQRKADGSTLFATRSALITAAKNIAKKLGYTNVKITEDGTSMFKRASKSIPPKMIKNKSTSPTLCKS